MGHAAIAPTAIHNSLRREQEPLCGRQRRCLAILQAEDGVDRSARRHHGTLRAIASAQDIVSTRCAKGADLSALVDALVVLSLRHPIVSSSAVMLPTEDVTPFALILHELATKALKHGAWASDQGRATLT
jgi:two-component sensor histidine kinase